MSQQGHETKLVKYGDEQAYIDVEISELVLNLWKLGLTTTNSCKDNVPKGFVWIEFASAYDAEMFLNFVRRDLEFVEKQICKALWHM